MSLQSIPADIFYLTLDYLSTNSLNLSKDFCTITLVCKHFHQLLENFLCICRNSFSFISELRNCNTLMVDIIRMEVNFLTEERINMIKTNFKICDKNNFSHIAKNIYLDAFFNFLSEIYVTKPPKLENIIWYRFEYDDNKEVTCFLNALHDAEINFRKIEQKCDDIVTYRTLEFYIIKLYLNIKNVLKEHLKFEYVFGGNEFILNIIEKLKNYKRNFILCLGQNNEYKNFLENF